MKKEKIQELATKLLVPLFSGAKLDEPVRVRSGTELVTYAFAPTKIKFKIKKSDRHAFVIQRRQNFPKRSSSLVNEFKIVDAFVEVVAEFEDVLSKLGEHLNDFFLVRLISTALSNGDKILRNTLISTICQLDTWSRGTYEGRQHSAAVVITDAVQSSGIPATNIFNQPYACVLSNGYDTAIVCSKDGYITGHNVINQDHRAGAYAPYRLIPIAHWSENGKICLVLNRKGEILIFIDKHLCFARRCGRWHFLTHDPIIKQIQYPNTPKKIRASIYETCLDVSFAGTGACIGIILDSKMKHLGKIIARKSDRISSKKEKSTLLRSIVNKQKIYDIPRLTRMELAAIDGALLVRENGDILAVGTILKIKSGSESGGRLAAAIELAKYGVGIKVSQDGSIRGFLPDSTPLEPALSLM